MVGRLGLSLLYHPMQKNNTASSSGIQFYLGSSNLLSSKTDDESNAGDKGNINSEGAGDAQDDERQTI